MTSIAGLVVNMYQSHAHPVILDISKQVCHNRLYHMVTGITDGAWLVD